MTSIPNIAGDRSAGPSLALCIIVKNEAHILRRCLEAARPLLDYALIVDTGSSDGTIALARRIMADLDLPGEVIEHPWRDFAYNRSHALAALREHSDIDYALMIDADDLVTLAGDFDARAFKAGLNVDAYSIRTVIGGVSYLRPQIISNRKPFRFRSILHEFLACDEDFTQDTASGLHVAAIQDSARNQDPDKFRRDAAMLETALQSETDAFLRARYAFYLAQSYRDCDQTEKSIAAYLSRAEMGFWNEEVYCSLLYAARQMIVADWPNEQVIDIYLKAIGICPERAEAMHGLARLYRLSELYGQGAAVAERGLDLAPPPSGLFVESWIYHYGLRDEFAVNAYWANRPRTCLSACIELLARDDLPEQDRSRIAANARFALEKLALAPD